MCVLCDLAMTSQMLPTSRSFEDLFGLFAAWKEAGKHRSPWIVLLYGTHIICWLRKNTPRVKTETVVSVAAAPPLVKITVGLGFNSPLSLCLGSNANAHAMLGTWYFKKITPTYSCGLRRSFYATNFSIVRLPDSGGIIATIR